MEELSCEKTLTELEQVRLIKGCESPFVDPITSEKELMGLVDICPLKCTEKSVFQIYLEVLRKKWHDTEDPYLLYEKTQPSHKDYKIYGQITGFEFRNYTMGEIKKTFDIIHDGRLETIIIWKDGNR